MGRYIVLTLFAFSILLMASYASAANACNPQISLLNQDPYPAIPGEYVKVVFQIDGLSNSVCGNFFFELSNDYPIQFDPGASNSIVLQSGAYVNNYGSFALVPFKVRVSDSALDGNNEVWVRYAPNYQSGQSTSYLQKFNIAVNDTKTDFDISVKDYDAATQTITFEILNIGRNDVDGLTVDLPRQENFSVKGSTRAIIGSFNKDEDTSFTFEGVPKQGNINLLVQYGDSINVRREVNKTVYFDPELFTGRIGQQKSTNYTLYVVLVVIIVLVVWWIVSRRNKRKKLEKMQMLALRKK